VHDATNLDAILSLAFYTILAVFAFAALGGAYLVWKYGPRLARKLPLDRAFVPTEDGVDL